MIARKTLSILLCLFIILTVACHGPDASKGNGPSYTLSGKIDGLEEGLVFIRHRQMPERGIDTAVIHDGVFEFTGRADTPEFCNLGFLNNGQMDFRLGFFLQNGELKLTGRVDSLDDAAIKITGSPTEDEFSDLSRKLKDSAGPAVDTTGLIRKKLIKEFAARHPSSFVSAFVIRQEYGYNPDFKELDSIYKGLDVVVRGSYYGRQIKEVLEKARIIDLDQPAPEFTQHDPSGKTIALSSFKGKYLLVDFWASWCGPCRRENPTVVKAYRKWHRKGFEILGVSLDDNKAKWMEAIKKDSLIWPQVTDLKGWQNGAATLYGVRGIPINFLLDKKGKIIAKNLRGSALEEKLATLSL